MGGGNADVQGAKAQQARERKQAKAPKGSTSQTKSNAAAQSIICNVCKATFQGTSKQPTLQTHVDGKHAKLSFADCFPGFATAA